MPYVSYVFWLQENNSAFALHNNIFALHIHIFDHDINQVNILKQT